MALGGCENRFYCISLKTLREMDPIMVVVDWLTKMAHFVPCTKSDDTYHMAHLYLNEIVNSITRSIISARDSKFFESLLEVFVEDAWHQMALYHHLWSLNGWTKWHHKHDHIHFVKKHGGEESQRMGSQVGLYGVCLQLICNRCLSIWGQPQSKPLYSHWPYSSPNKGMSKPWG